MGKRESSEQAGNPLPTFRDEVGTRLREIESEFRNRGEAAKAAGVSRSAFQAWVLGQSDPSFEGLARLAQATGYTLDWIATGRGPKRLGEVHAAHALHEAAAAPPPAPGAFDEFLMLNTIVEVEDMLDVELGEKKNNLDIYWKAKLIVYVYKRYIESRSSGKRFTGADIVRLIRATPDASSDS